MTALLVKIKIFAKCIGNIYSNTTEKKNKM